MGLPEPGGSNQQTPEILCSGSQQRTKFRAKFGGHSVDRNRYVDRAQLAAGPGNADSNRHDPVFALLVARRVPGAPDSLQRIFEDNAGPDRRLRKASEVLVGVNGPQLFRGEATQHGLSRRRAVGRHHHALAGTYTDRTEAFDGVDKMSLPPLKLCEVDRLSSFAEKVLQSGPDKSSNINLAADGKGDGTERLTRLICPRGGTAPHKAAI